MIEYIYLTSRKIIQVIFLYHFEETKNNVAQCLAPLVEKLKNDLDIVAIYLFGSFAAGMQTPLSDIDLAIILDHNLPPSRYFKKKLDLLAIVTSLLKTDAVDLVILNQAPLALSYQVLGKGRLVYEKKGGKTQRIGFQVKTFDQYFDFKPVERILHEGLIKRIKEGRFGGG